MDRLTEVAWRNLDKWETCGQDYNCKAECKHCIVPKLYVRLAKYEDINLTPEEVEDHEEMFKAYRSVCGGKSPDEVINLYNECAKQTALAESLKNLVSDLDTKNQRLLDNFEAYDESALEEADKYIEQLEKALEIACNYVGAETHPNTTESNLVNYFIQQAQEADK